MQQIYLTILVPAYNEEKRLPKTLIKIDEFCRLHLQKAYELLVIDDGSVDGTSAAVKELQNDISAIVLHRYEKNRGKGYALRTGMHLAGGQFILFSDADLSTPIEELPGFLAKLEEGVPVVIATRKNSQAKVLKRQPAWRESMGKIFTLLSNLILGMRISDFTCGFKAFHAPAGKRIFKKQKIRGWAYDSEILFLANQLGYQIEEIPVQWEDSPESKVRIIGAALTSFGALLAIRWNWITGKYREVEG